MGRRATTEDRLPVPSSASKDGRHRRRATTDDRPNAAADKHHKLEKEGRQRGFGRSETFEERVRRKLEENEGNKMNGSAHSQSRRPRHLAASMPADGQGAAAGASADAYAAEYEARVRREVEGSSGHDSHLHGSGHSANGSANGSRHRPRHLTSSMPNNTGGGGFEELLRRKMEEAGENGGTSNKEKGASKYSLDKAYSLRDKQQDDAATPKKKTAAKSSPHVGMEDYLDVSSHSFELPYATLSQFKQEHSTLVLPASHPALASLLDDFSSTGMEALLKKRWEYQFAGVKAFKREHGDCLIPASHPTLGKWMRGQREQYLLYEKRMPTPLTKKRYGKLRDVGFDEFVKWEGATAASASAGVGQRNGRKEGLVEGQRRASNDANDGIDDTTDSSLERNDAGAANQLTLEQRIEPKLAAEGKWRASNDGHDGTDDTADSSLKRNGVGAAAGPQTLEERIEQKLAAANNKEGGGDGPMKKDLNRAKFMERGIQAHNSSDNKGHNKQRRRKATKEEVAAELHRKRMLQRSLGSLSKRKVVVATELDAWREEEGGGTHNDEDGRDDGGGLLRSYAHLVRSCSASNLCPGSWECPRCATVNEPLGLDPRTTCGVCRELKPDDSHEEGATAWGGERQTSFKLEEVVPRRSLRLEDIGVGPTAAMAPKKSAAAWMGQRGQESVDDINVESWSELGTVLTTAARQSVVEYMSRRRL